jgi:hypothetical protein
MSDWERLLFHSTSFALFASFAVIVCLSFSFASFAQDDTKPDVPAASGPSSADELALEQSRVADKYAKLEQLMLKMAELEGQSNPKRAQLLTRAVEQSKERLTKPQLDTLVKLLNQKQLKRAIDGQATVQTDLKALLELLMSEDRSDRLKSEQQRLKEYIKEVERLIRLEKSLQGQTESGANAKKMAEEQARIAAQTGDLSKKIRENEEPAEAQEGGDKKNESSDEKSGDQGKQEKSADGKSDKSDKSEKGNKAGDEKNNEDKKDGKSDEKSSDEKGGQSKSGDQQSGDEKSGQKGGDDKAGKQKSGKQKSGDDKSGKQKSETQKSDGQKRSGDEKGEKSSQQGQKGENQPSENQQGQNQEGQEGQQQQGQQQQGQQQQGQQQQGQQQQGQQGQQNEQNENQQQNEQQQNNQQQNPARQRLDRAQQKMQEAQKKLEDAKRSESIEEQRAAREELEKAKADLEEILRQLREEEIARTLAQLEGRFRKMLQMQLAVNESTRRLDQLPPERRGEPFLVQSGKLSADEKKIAVEAQKALTLLQEEGSSIAFPATVEQMHSDMEQVAQRLADAKIDDITIGVEEDIVAALEEMIAALQQAQRDQEEKQQQQQQQQQQQGDDEQPLVDQIAELRMIKSLQERVNKRTQRYAKLLSDENDPIGHAEAPELADAVKKLGDRQLEIFRITRDIVLGKNQ